MASKAQRKAAITDVVNEVAQQVADKLDHVVEVDERKAEQEAKRRYLNRDGEILQCNLTLQKMEGKPDPLVITIAEEIRWIKRGKPVVVPWYVVQTLKDNIESRYRREKQPDGTTAVVREDVPAEAFSYNAINPADGVVF